MYTGNIMTQCARVELIAVYVISYQTENIGILSANEKSCNFLLTIVSNFTGSHLQLAWDWISLKAAKMDSVLNFYDISYQQHNKNKTIPLNDINNNH